MTMTFKKAERKQARLRLGLSSPAGGGKTTAALKIAKGLGGRIAVIDTERGSASLYSHIVDFDTLDLGPPYSPERYIEAIQAAERAGYDTLIIDSTTHEWDGSGGCLEINEANAGSKFRGNTWAAWNETTPRHRAFLDAILQCKMHVICTLRSKTETVQEGKQILKLGMKAIQREGIEYELTTVLEIAHGSHLATAAKDRTGLFKDPCHLTEETGRRLLGWLNSGAKLAPEPTAKLAPAPQPQAATTAPPDDGPLEPFDTSDDNGMDVPAHPAVDVAGMVAAAATLSDMGQIANQVAAVNALYSNGAVNDNDVKQLIPLWYSRSLHCAKALQGKTMAEYEQVTATLKQSVIGMFNATQKKGVAEAFAAVKQQIEAAGKPAAEPEPDPLFG